MGTMGSWGLYVTGIMTVCVFLLGPNTNFGQSELNPAFWFQLLLSAKRNGATVTWYDPVAHAMMKKDLNKLDIGIWFRFVLSFLINGIGFHLLIHTLPIQIATQSSLLGVIFRAVGMVS